MRQTATIFCTSLGIFLALGCSGSQATQPAEADATRINLGRPGPGAEAGAQATAPTEPERAATSTTAFVMPPRSSATPTLGIPAVVSTFEQHRSKHENIEFLDLLKQLKVERAPKVQLSFRPEDALYYKEARESLQLTEDEESLLRKNGFVEVDHAQPYTMGSLYYGIYTRDLPVLITTDSLLYAWHRSFDNMLADLETLYLAPQLKELLTAAHARLKSEISPAQGAARRSLRDAELYLVVAMNLLEGAGMKRSPALPVHTFTGQDGEVIQILNWVNTRKFQDRWSGRTNLFSAPRSIDYTQMVPRGHYTKSETLKRYFQTMMWLGRDDTGVTLVSPRGEEPLDAKQREAYRDALTLSALLGDAKSRASLASFRKLINQLIGPGSELTPEEVQDVSARLPVTDAVLDPLLPQLRRLGGQALVRSNIMYVSPDPQAEEAPLQTTFQMFGQRFTLDAFALSKMVHDSVRHKGAKVERWMPEGRDAMAALGNNEAVFQLEKSLKHEHYGGNLLAARKVVEGYSAGDWAQSTYNRWLGTLRTLDDAPEGPFAPQVMKGRLWQTKQLETQISSWANLRHDTILYTKQSYTAGALCEYPTGYVEPYPDFYRALADMARPLAELLAEASKPFDALLLQYRDVPRDKRRSMTKEEREREQGARNIQYVLARAAQVFQLFDDTAIELERLARKELAGLPFTDDERFFLKQTVDLRGGGSGPPTYDGWYTRLIYGEKPDTFTPTVSDVHTNTQHKSVLQVGVGSAKYLLVAIDNGEDKMIFVGPKYSYYEFTGPAATRMTDEKWTTLLTKGGAPDRPSWTSEYRAAPRVRSLKGDDIARNGRGTRLKPQPGARTEYELRGRKGFGQLPTEH